MTKKKRSRHQSSPEFHGTKNHRWGVPPGLLCPGHCQLHQTYSELPSTSSPANSVRAPADSSPDGGEWPRRARRPACRFPRHRRRSPRRARGGPSPVGAAPRQLCISCPRAPAPARWQGLARRGGGGLNERRRATPAAAVVDVDRRAAAAGGGRGSLFFFPARPRRVGGRSRRPRLAPRRAATTSPRRPSPGPPSSRSPPACP